MMGVGFGGCPRITPPSVRPSVRAAFAAASSASVASGGGVYLYVASLAGARNFANFH